MMHKVEESEILRLIREVEAEHLAEVAAAESGSSGSGRGGGSESTGSGSGSERSNGSTAGSEVGSPKLS